MKNEQNWTDKMKMSEYEKLCEYCKKNGYKARSKEIKLHERSRVIDKDIYDFFKKCDERPTDLSVLYSKPHTDIEVRCVSSSFVNTHINFMYVQVFLRRWFQHSSGFGNRIETCKMITTLDEFVEYTNKADKLTELFNDFNL